MYGLAYIFINYVQAMHLGHVAWGFSLDDGETFVFGSTDHLWRHPWWNMLESAKYMHVGKNGEIDWWAATGTREEMLKVMKSGGHLRYHAYKVIQVDKS